MKTQELGVQKLIQIYKSLEQISGGYTTQAVTDGQGIQLFLYLMESTGATLSHRIIEFTGSLTGARNVTIPLDVQNFYFLKNSTSGSQTVTFKYATGTGTSAAVLNGKTVIAYAKADDGTNPNISTISLASDVVDDTSPQLGGNLDTNSFMIDFDDAHGIRDENANEQLIFETTSSAVNHIDVTNAATGSGPQVGAVGDDSNVDLKLRPKGTGNIEVMGATNPGAIQLNCESNSHGIILQSPPHSSGQSYTLKFPTGNVTADRFLKVESVTGSGATGVGQLSFAEVSGGTSWQAVKTSTFTAVAGEGYFINTTGGAIEMDLPAGNIGDEVSFIDYAGTFDTNALTIDQNGSEKIAGSTDPLTVSTERAANTLVYVDSTQGWLLKNN